MRNPNRIHLFLEKLEKLWLKNPDLRFGQLIECIFDYCETEMPLFYAEDNIFEDAIENYDYYKFGESIKSAILIKSQLGLNFGQTGRIRDADNLKVSFVPDGDPQTYLIDKKDLKICDEEYKD